MTRFQISLLRGGKIWGRPILNERGREKERESVCENGQATHTLQEREREMSLLPLEQHNIWKILGRRWSMFI
jgi:hypothetical protein